MMHDDDDDDDDDDIKMPSYRYTKSHHRDEMVIILMFNGISCTAKMTYIYVEMTPKLNKLM